MRRSFVFLIFLVASSTGNAALAQVVTIDLGTFGGYSGARAINDFGQVVGFSHNRAFSWTVKDGMVDLGQGLATDVNNSGQVVGQVGGHAFLWTAAGGAVDLGTLGGSSSIAYAVNEHSQVVGWSYVAGDQEYHAFSWTADAGILDLGAAGVNSIATALNDNGAVVGITYMAGSAGFQAVMWATEGGRIDLGTLGGNYTGARAVNASGQVVGYSYDSEAVSHAFSWTAEGGMVDIGSFADGTYSWAWAVNNLGQTVGAITKAGAFDSHPFSWTAAGGMTDLGTLGGGADRSLSAEAQAVNTFGQVAGWSYASDNLAHAFSWTAADGLVDLGTFGGVPYDPISINESGQIAGSRIVDGSFVPTMWLLPGVTIQILVDTLTSYGLDHGLNNALLAKLESARASLDRGTSAAAVASHLKAFVKQVNALSGHALTGDQANQLVRPATVIIESIQSGTVIEGS